MWYLNHRVSLKLASMMVSWGKARVSPGPCQKLIPDLVRVSVLPLPGDPELFRKSILSRVSLLSTWLGEVSLPSTMKLHSEDLSISGFGSRNSAVLLKEKIPEPERDVLVWYF